MQPNGNPTKPGQLERRPTAYLPATRPQPPRPCPDCAGEGYLISVGAPGTWDDLEDCWMPTETLDPCDACQGTGREGGSASGVWPDVDPLPSYLTPLEPEPPLDF
jgi:hypothetical protein